MADELKIGISVDVAGLAQLAEASKTTAGSIESLTAEFVKGTISAEEVAAALGSAATAFVTANPAIAAQAENLVALRGQLAGAQAALRETNETLADAATKGGATADFYELLGIETKKVADLQTVLKSATQQLNITLAGSGEAAAVASNGHKVQAAAALQAAEAQAVNAAEAKLASASLSQAGQSAQVMGAAMVEGSAAVQATGQRFISLTRDLAILRDQLLQTRAAMLEVGLTQEQLAAITAQFGQQYAAVGLLTNEAKTAETEYKVALEDSLTARIAAAEAATKKALADQASADAAQMATAANEGMVDTEIQVAQAEQAAALASQARADALAQEAAAGEGMVAGDVAQTAAANALTQAKVAQRAAAAANANALLQDAGAAKQAAQAVLELGLSGDAATKMLMRQGLTAEQAATALAACGNAAKEAAAEETGAAAAASNLGDQHEIAAVKIDAMTRVLASSGVRIAAAELGVGQLGYALSRIGGISATLAPILAAAFPVFAALALFQIVESLGKKMVEWSEEEEKSAAEGAKWERQILKSGEAVDKMKEKLAGMASPLAEAAERLANLSHKVIDVSTVMEEANKRIEDNPGLMTRFARGVGELGVEAWHLFDSSSEDAGRSLEKFNDKIKDSIKTSADLPKALQDITDKLRALKQEAANVPLQLRDDTNLANYARQIEIAEQTKTQIVNMMQAEALERLAIQQSIDEKLFAAQTSASLARISLEEAEAKTINKLHIGTFEDESRELLRLEHDRTAAQLSEVNKREAALRVQANAETAAAKASGTQAPDFSPAFKAMEDEKGKIRTEGQRREFEIIRSTNQQIIDSDLARAETEIAVDEKVGLATLKLQEIRNKIAFSHSDTPWEVEAAAIPMIQDATAAYETETIAIRKRIAALLDSVAAEQKEGAGKAQTPTAEIGTPEFKKQLEPFAKVDQTGYNQILKMLAQLTAKTDEFNAHKLQSEEETDRKIKELRSQELSNQIEELNTANSAERGAYQDNVIALQANLLKHKEHWTTYYTDVKALSQASLDRELENLDTERTAVETAYLDGTRSAEEAGRQIAAIQNREVDAFKEAKKRELEAAKEAARQEEEAITRSVNKISSEFVRMGNTILTTHTSIGRAALQLGRELELYIIEQGIKRVVEKWATSLLQMLAADNSFLAQILNIHSAGAAREILNQQAAEAKETATHAAAVAQRGTIDTTAALKQQTVRMGTAINASAIETTETAQHATAETAKAGATVAGQSAQTAAATTGAAARGQIGIIEDLKSIGRAAATAAAHAFKWVMEEVPFPLNVALAPAAAAAAFVGVMAFQALASAEEGASIGADRQPVLVHSGEIITHSQTLNDLSSSQNISTSSSNHAMRVERDQISMLQPGMVVVPKALAGGLESVVNSAGGTVSIAPGVTPPSDIREIPQKLPSNVSSTITSIVNRHSNDSKTAIGGSTVVKVPTAGTPHAASGYVFTAKEGFVDSSVSSVSAKDGFVSSSVSSAKEGFVLSSVHSAKEGYAMPSAAQGFVIRSAASGDVVPSRMIGFAHAATSGQSGAPGGVGGPGGRGGDAVQGGQTINHNHFRPTIVVNHPGTQVTHEDIVKSVRRGMREGALTAR